MNLLTDGKAQTDDCHNLDPLGPCLVMTDCRNLHYPFLPWAHNHGVQTPQKIAPSLSSPCKRTTLKLPKTDGMAIAKVMGKPKPRKVSMPQTITRTTEGQIIGGTFSDSENADKAVEALQELGVPASDIEVVVQLNEKEAKKAYTDMLSERGFADSQAAYYDKAIKEGKTLVVVYGVTDAKPVIDIFDKYKAEYNPSGSRNLRDDVAGMTTGAVLGAAVGGAAGMVAGGPLGAAAGAAAGIAVGGGVGGAAGKAAEHRK